MSRLGKYFRGLLAVHLLVWGSGILGCSTATPLLQLKDAGSGEGIPSDSGLAFGRIRLEGWAEALMEKYPMHIHLQHETTQQRFTHTLDKSGEFLLALPAAHYQHGSCDSILFTAYRTFPGS